MQLSKSWAHLARQLGRFSPDDENERCGLLYERHGVFSFYETDNSSDDAQTTFVLKLDAVMEFGRKYPGVLLSGFLHTHPGRTMLNDVPSNRDLAGAAKWTELLHAVYHPYSRKIMFYSKDRGPYAVIKVPIRLKGSFNG